MNVVIYKRRDEDTDVDVASLKDFFEPQYMTYYEHTCNNVYEIASMVRLCEANKDAYFRLSYANGSFATFENQEVHWTHSGDEDSIIVVDQS
jgi:hypothetical protein